MTYVDLSKLLHGSVKVDSRIFQCFSIFVLLFAKQNQVERFEEVKVVNALGPLCLWQCL